MANEDKKKISRRSFVKNSSYAAGGLIGGGLLGSLIGVNLDGSKEEVTIPSNKSTNQAFMYFTREADFKTLSAATERIFPEDDNGPGAIELGVPYFIDHQLAGSYGHNDQEYMQGPFHEGSDFQGYQTPLKRHQVFMEGIRALDHESNKKHDGAFNEIEDNQQDEILKKFEDDKVKLKGVKASMFFDLLKDATMAGAYADPLYGGNIGMEGWKMKEYPGHQMSYASDIENKEFTEIEPQSLSQY